MPLTLSKGLLVTLEVCIQRSAEGERRKKGKSKPHPISYNYILGCHWANDLQNTMLCSVVHL